MIELEVNYFKCICCVSKPHFLLDVKQVIVDNFVDNMDKVMRPFLPNVIQYKAIEKKKVGVLISGSGTNLQALIDATLDPSQHMGAEIVLVISNKPDVEGLKRAHRAKIPTRVSVFHIFIFESNCKFR